MAGTRVGVIRDGADRTFRVTLARSSGDGRSIADLPARVAALADPIVRKTYHYICQKSDKSSPLTSAGVAERGLALVVRTLTPTLSRPPHKGEGVAQVQSNARPNRYTCGSCLRQPWNRHR